MKKEVNFELVKDNGLQKFYKSSEMLTRGLIRLTGRITEWHKGNKTIINRIKSIDMKKTADDIIDKLDEKYGEDNYSILDIVNFTMKELLPEWIKIESEKDLPKDRVLCWFNDKKDGVTDGGVLSYNKQFILENATHYMPIIKPEPPKED